MLESRRSKILAAALATVAGTLCGTAQAATLSLSTSGESAFLCGARVLRSDNTFIVSEPQKERIAKDDSKYFDLGPLRVGQYDLSPDFSALILTCWLRTPSEYGEAVDSAERSHTLILARTDPLWLAVDPSTGAHSIELPRDDTVLSFELAATSDPQRPLRIVGASLNRLDNGRLLYKLGTAQYLFTRS